MDCCVTTFLKRTRRSGEVVLPRHRHERAHLALVISGGYEEAGDRGCFRVAAGDVLLHSAYEAHIDRFSSGGAEVLDLALPLWTTWPDAAMHIPDPDLIARTAERDSRAAVALVLAHMQPVERAVDDWPHRLAQAIGDNPHLRITAWAHKYRLAEATVSRGFQKVFGITPNAYRAHQRARGAAHLAASSSKRLQDIAYDYGFSDQSHMTRAVQTLTGITPGAWRHQSV